MKTKPYSFMQCNVSRSCSRNVSTVIPPIPRFSLVMHSATLKLGGKDLFQVVLTVNDSGILSLLPID